MKRSIVMVLLGLSVCSLSLTVYGNEGHEQGAQDGVQTISGEVVDLACYLTHGASGAEHQQCAKDCISKGLPVAIKSGGTLYLAISKDHTPANGTLASLAAQQVTVQGNVTEKDGVHLIAVEKVTKQ